MTLSPDNKAMLAKINRESAPSAPLKDLEFCVPNPSPWLQTAMSVPRSEGFIDTGDCQLKFYRWGDPSKPGIIMQHGFLAHSRCFAFIAPYLANDYHVVAYDHSGMGDSTWREEYNDDIRVQEMQAVCEATGLFDNQAKPLIISHSFGCRIGTFALKEHPGRFAGMIFCDLMIIRPDILKKQAKNFGPPGKSRDPNRPNRVYPDYATAKQRFVLSPPQEVGHPELFEFMAYHSLKEVDGGWQWKFDPRVIVPLENAKGVWTEIGTYVATAPGRKSMIHGDQSILFTADSKRYLRELAAEHGVDEFPVVGIPNAGHHLMLDQPQALVSLLRIQLENWRH